MNKALLHKALDILLKENLITLDMLKKVGCSYDDAFSMLLFLTDKKIIADNGDGKFLVLINTDNLAEFMRKNNNWHKVFSNEEIEKKSKVIDLSGASTLYMIEESYGMTEKEIVKKTVSAEVEKKADSIARHSVMASIDNDPYHRIFTRETVEKLALADIYPTIHNLLRFDFVVFKHGKYFSLMCKEDIDKIVALLKIKQNERKARGRANMNAHFNDVIQKLNIKNRKDNLQSEDNDTIQCDDIPLSEDNDIMQGEETPQSKDCYTTYRKDIPLSEEDEATQSEEIPSVKDGDTTLRRDIPQEEDSDDGRRCKCILKRDDGYKSLSIGKRLRKFDKEKVHWLADYKRVEESFDESSDQRIKKMKAVLKEKKRTWRKNWIKRKKSEETDLYKKEFIIKLSNIKNDVVEVAVLIGDTPVQIIQKAIIQNGDKKVACLFLNKEKLKAFKKNDKSLNREESEMIVDTKRQGYISLNWDEPLSLPAKQHIIDLFLVKLTPVFWACLTID
ncbi:MAG: hypothetical protein RSB59_00130 [Clostridia bacterium]